jgi:uncharacterized membrane protein
MKRKIVLTVLAAMLLVAACSKKATTTTATKEATITYTLNIKPLMETKCAPCHLPAKGGRKEPFDTYEATKSHVNVILKRISLAPTESGFMPMKNEALSAEEIALIKKWKEEGLAQ